MGRPDELTSWHDDWSGLRVLVLGLGVTGFSVADTLAELGARVLVAARQPDEDRARILPVIGVDLLALDDELAVPPDLDALDPQLVVVSPGYPPEHALITWARDRGTPVWGDVELAWRLRDKVAPAAEWILITGTNGKTTTTQLTATMLLDDGRRVAPCGNIGVPVLDAIRDPAGFDVLVVELSSFQLHWMPVSGPGAVHPLASACLNLADDHYDWHGSAAAYAAAKAKVYANTRVACVYNLGDEATMRMVEEAEVAEGCRAIGFGAAVPTPSNVGVVDEFIVDRAFLDDRQRSALELASLDDVMTAGLATPHGLANVLAAAALARAAGAEPRAVRDALRHFTVDAHRTQLVLTEGEIAWVDDSKATNPHAAASALSAYRSVVWIVGGLLKGVDVAPLVQSHRDRLRAVIVIGSDRAAVRAAFERHAPELPLFEVEQEQTDGVMPAAVRLAAGVAHAGDTVLLAPAAASMDQFADYADRGNRFAAAVRQHVKGESDDYRPTPAPRGD
ncbi:UDP-N-acetylmuramoyl-L-alanine--D-glutamate ligase [Microcella sp.]|uniref:UDP-N-acetylmuramoyl-L-alanine--D-glutamate ligase n=1 Tax=Microcella sp. TaxID=1913979 RepID=UPI002566140C|nr:UDP-N-acetylmuramoyl-L-alanine--D-glutamate ligase [Microcella sp.]MBX9470470.1 UDP-N-acetylmuramoyl-L-alanine--D-glutamate ligase [Microcella sp.]MBX9470481.1 UDP-N-acetylmuramoyl-L-alanine--D-glutamate ligase [Microcella sp.]